MSVRLIPMLSWGFCSNVPAGSPTGDQDVLDFEVAARAQRVAEVADWRTGTLTLAAGYPQRCPGGAGADRGDQFAACSTR